MQLATAASTLVMLGLHYIMKDLKLNVWHKKIWCSRTLWKVGQGMMSFNTTVVTRNSFWLFKWGGRRRLLSIHTFLVVLLFASPFHCLDLQQKSSPKYWGQELAKRGCKSHTKHTNICTLPLSVLSPSSPYFWLYCTRCIFKEVEILFDLFLIAWLLESVDRWFFKVDCRNSICLGHDEKKIEKNGPSIIRSMLTGDH